MSVAAADTKPGETGHLATPPPPRSLLRQCLADLRPFPGRAALTWRIALLCALVAATAMLYQTPEAAISCYLIIFLMKPDAVQNIGTALGLIVLVIIIVALMIPLISITVESPALRLLAIALVSFAFLYLGAASQLGEIGGVIALVIAFILTLVNMAPLGDVVTFGLRYAAYMALMPMALMVVFNLVLGISPVRLLRQLIVERLEAAARRVADMPGAGEALTELLRADNAAREQQAMFVKMLALVGRDAAGQIGRDVRASYRLMLAVAALTEADDGRRAALVAAIEAARQALETGEKPPRPVFADTPASEAERQARLALEILAGAPEGEVIAAPKPAFFAPDALSNPAYQRFALKTTAAAVICYLVYAGINWQGIHTAMITCYVAALGTTGETVHKLGLRITGCLIGAAMGIGSILFVMPQLETVGGLMVLVFLGVLVGAWVSTGPERIAYGGVQIALAFLLTVLHDFGPTTDLSTAWDRIVGILLGNVVVWVIFTQLWPVSLESAIRTHLRAATDALSRLATLPPGRRAGAVGEAALVEAEVGKAGELLALMPFEPSDIRPAHDTQNALRAAADGIAALNGRIFFGGADVSDELGRLTRTVAA